MNVLVLAAGSDHQFQEAGLPFPKNLTEIGGIPLIERVLRSLPPVKSPARQIVVLQQREDRGSHTGLVVRLANPASRIILAPSSTSGAACTALLAAELIDNGEPLLIVNGDVVVDVDLAMVIDGFTRRCLDGGTVVFHATHPRWSFVRLDASGLVLEATEKRPISRWATAGVYWFARGSDFVAAAKSMILKEARTNDLFYLCPVYNELILRGAKVGVHEISRECYHSLSTPQGVEEYSDWLRMKNQR